MARRKKPVLELNQALRIAWKRGLLTYKLYDYQLELFEIVSEGKSIKTVINSSRRWGKTTVLLLYAIIYAIQNPGAQVKIATTTAKSLRKTIFPIMRMLIADAPKDFKPVWNSQDECYRLWNGSEIHVHGTDAQRHDGLRGQRTDLGIIDEASYCSDLNYVVQDILLPQTLTCEGRIIMASTPSKKVTRSGEEFKNFCLQAEVQGSYFTKTIYDNKSLSPELIKKYMEESGGEDSITWQVEYLCKFMVDPEKRLVPEWNSLYLEDFPLDQHRGFYHNYVCMDLGVKRDFTCMLFGYYNFTEAKLIILDEHIMKNMTTLELVNDMKAKEKKNFGSLDVYRRIADSDNPLLLNDMGTLHGLAVIPTNKTTLETMVNHMRTFVGEGRLVVHPRCTYLQGCLEHGVWADNQMGRERRDFGRTTAYGHFDGIAALMYLIRNLDQFSNPIPPLNQIDPNNSYISNGFGDNKANKSFGKMFKRFK